MLLPRKKKKQGVTGGFSFGGICDHINHLGTLFLKGKKCMSGGGGEGGEGEGATLKGLHLGRTHYGRYMYMYSVHVCSNTAHKKKRLTSLIKQPTLDICLGVHPQVHYSVLLTIIVASSRITEVAICIATYSIAGTRLDGAIVDQSCLC